MTEGYHLSTVMKQILFWGDDNTCCTVFPALIFIKLNNDQQHHMQVSCISFNVTWTINVESTDMKSFM